MNKQRKTSHILNVFQYDADGHVVLPASLTLGIVPGAEDNSGKVPSTAWVRGLLTTRSSTLVPTNRTITINGLTYDLSSNPSFSINTGVLTASSGVGISVSVSNQNLNIVNTGLLTASSGAGITVSTSNQNVNIVNTGLLTASSGAGITVTTSNQNVNIVNTGLLTATAGSGITVTTSNQNVNIVNNGILTATAGAGISVTTSNGNLNIVNTITNNNQLDNGAGYATTSYVTTQINNLVAGAPGLLDTLDELAAALGDDANFATTTATSLGNRLRIDIGTQGLTSTQQGYGRTNLGLGTAALSATGDFATAAQGTKADTAHGWGNHASASYLTTSSAASTYVSLTGSYANPSWITSLAYSKITGVPAFLTSYTETDTLASVTGRGATTSTNVTFNGLLNFAAVGNVSFTSNDASSYPRFTGNYSSAQIGLFRAGSAVGGMYIGGTGTGFYVFDSSFNIRLLINQNGDTAFNSSTVTVGGNQIWHAGNLTNLNQLTNGPGYITGYTETDTLASVTGRGSSTNSAITINNTLTLNTSSTQPVLIYGDNAATNGLFRIQIDEVNDSFGSGARTFLGDGGIDIFIGTGNSSYTPANSYIALNHSGEISMGAGSATKHFVIATSGAATFSSTISASNFSGSHSGSSSGTNTGDQTNISGQSGTSLALNGNGSVTTAPLTNQLFYTGQISSGASGLFAATDNANSIITLNRHPGAYDSQLGFSSNGNLYYRNFINTSINTTQAWQIIWTSSSLTNLNQLTNGPGYITGESDTLSTVTSRGATTSISVRFGTHADLSPTGSAFRFYDGTTFRGGFGLDSWGHGGSDANLVLYVNGDNTLFFSTSGTKRASLSSSAFNSLVAIQQNGNQVLHAGNYSSYAFPASGGTLNGYLTVSANWATSPYTSALTIIGTYPSITFRGSNSDWEWLQHVDSAGNFHFYGGAGYTANNWSNKLSIKTSGQLILKNHSTADSGYDNPLWIWATADSDAIVIQNTTSGGNAPKIYFRDTNGIIQTGNSEIRLRTSNSNSLSAYLNGGDWYATGSMRAPIFYDSNNTSYYVDPDSTSNVNAITMAGTLAMYGGAYYGTITFGTSSYWRAGISQRDAGNAELRIWAKGGGAGSIYFATGFDGESSSTALPSDGMALKNNKLGIGSWGVSEFPSYKLHVKGDIYANGGWLRASGDSGIYFESYGGGWRMTGSSYIESYGSKSLHMQGASVDYVGSLYFSGAGHIQPNSGSYGALQMTSNKNGWAGIRFTEYNTNLMSNSTTSGFHHNDYGWQFKWESGNAYVYSGTYGGGSAYTVYHSGNLNPITTSNIGSQSVSYASNSGTVGSIGVSTLRGGISSNNYDFYVNGDANTYYPVVLSLGGQYGMHRYSISRGYSDPAPWDPIGTGSHRGGLTLTFDASSDIAWGGNDKSWRIIQFAEQYTNMVAGMALPVTDGIIVWLRGGGAYYRFHGPSGINHSATVYYSGYSAANGAVYYTRTNLNNVDSEIRAKWPIRGYGDGAMYVANNEVLHLGNYISYMDKLYYQGSQRLWTGSDGTRNSGWAYHQDNNTGIHWPNNGWHFYPKDASDMYVRAGSGSNVSLVMNTAGTNRGYVYADSSNQIGFLNNDRNWIFRMTSGGDAYAVSYYSSASTSKYLTSNTSSYTTWYVGGNNNGYSGFRVDGGMCLMMHTNGASGPTGFWLNNWSILTYVDSAQYLYHNGNEKFRTDGGGIYVTGTVYATGDVIAYYSDARLKKDVVTIDNAISKIKQLRGVTYIWNDEKVNVAKERAGTKDIGLIAQEVEAVEPLFITEYQSQLNTPSNDPEEAKNFVPEMSETYKTIKYEKLVALLVEGMKEQQLQIEELQNKLDNVLSSR